MKLSLARVSLVVFLLLEAAFSTAIYFLYSVQTREAPQTISLREGAQRLLSGQVLDFTSRMRETAARIAAHPQTIASLKSGSEAERIAQLSNLHALYPGLDIQLLPLSAGAADGSIYGAPLSAVHSRLIQAAKQLGPETKSSIRAQVILTTVQPVKDTNTGTVLGFVVIDEPQTPLQNIFDRVALKGVYAELQQFNLNSPYSVLLARGQASLKARYVETVTDLPGTTWRLAIWSPPPEGAGITASYLVVWALTSLVLAVAVAGMYRALTGALKRDMDSLALFFSDIRHSRLRKAYAVSLQDLAPSFEMLYQLGKLMIGKQRQVADYASMDHLSQVHNRRSFETKLRELYKTLSEGWAHSLLILDIDNFKHVNDTYGHDAGDILIVQFGKALKDHLRSSDFIARLGGDEFCVIFPNTPLKRATELAERLRSNMPETVELGPGIVHRLSWSGGLSDFQRADNTETMVLSRADSALLAAKRAGRNNTRVAA